MKKNPRALAELRDTLLPKLMRGSQNRRCTLIFGFR